MCSVMLQTLKIPWLSLEQQRVWFTGGRGARFSEGIDQGISVLMGCDPMAHASSGSGQSSPETSFGALTPSVDSQGPLPATNMQR